MNVKNEIKEFLDGWQNDSINAKAAFMEYENLLESQPDIIMAFVQRPGISYSMRAKNKKQKGRNVFVLVDVVDDEPENRWLSVCFYEDMIDDPGGLGDEVPAGLDGENAVCFNLDEDDPKMREYIKSRIEEAAKNAAK